MKSVIEIGNGRYSGKTGEQVRIAISRLPMRYSNLKPETALNFEIGSDPEPVPSVPASSGTRVPPEAGTCGYLIDRVYAPAKLPQQQATDSAPYQAEEEVTTIRELPVPFATPQNQIRLFRQLAKRFGWQFSREQWVKAIREIPHTRATPWLTPVLVPYLGSTNGTLERMIHALGETGCSVRFSKDFYRAYSNGCRHPANPTSTPQLRWEIINFGQIAPTDDEPLHIDQAAHLGVLAALLLNPSFRSSVGKKRPPLVLAGYLMTHPEIGDCHPVLRHDPNQDCPKIDVVAQAETHTEAMYPRLV